MVPGESFKVCEHVFGNSYINHGEVEMPQHGLSTSEHRNFVSRIVLLCL